MSEVRTFWDKLIGFILRQRLAVGLVTLLMLGWGIYVAPFDFDLDVERDPVPVDAIPDIGENQQIVFTDWPGRSPQDVEDQVTYPLATALQGIPQVETIRSFSNFGFSTIYVIFEEDADYYWSRSRVAEKLASLPRETLPEGITPQLGPDATALGQIFWYTLEARDENGEPVGGWDAHELRTLQDYYVRYGLAAAEGVSEVASIGGYEQEYHVDVDPSALRSFGVSIEQVDKAVRGANAEVGAGTVEMNGVDYLIRGIGFVQGIDAIEQAVVDRIGDVPVRVRDVARVEKGAALRTGALTKSGTEAVGGVVTARYGSNPRQVIDNVKEAMEEVEQSLPSRTLDDGTEAQVEIVPFYDRTDLIERTIGTLDTALYQQILITVLVVLLLMLHLRSSVLISTLLPLAVLMTFIAMKYTGVDANVVALAGIAIAIGTMVDMGIIMTENIVQHLDRADDEEDRFEVIRRGAAEVAPAILTAISTTVISFLPVFMLEGQEGKLFGPLAFTKTYALIASLAIALALIPILAYLLMGIRVRHRLYRQALSALVILGGLAATVFVSWPLGLIVVAAGVARIYDERTRPDQGGDDEEATSTFDVERFGDTFGRAVGWLRRRFAVDSATTGVARLANALAIIAVGVMLARDWLPLGPQVGEFRNILFVAVVVGGLLGFFGLFKLGYESMLRWLLDHKAIFLTIPASLVVVGLTIWLGFSTVFGWLPDSLEESEPGQWAAETFPGMEREFMPDLDEGTYLYMPSTTPHASIDESKEMLQQLDVLVETIPEVEYSVGKIGRAESALDPAPLSMVETIIEYKPEFRRDAQGNRIHYRVDDDGEFVRDDDGDLIEDEDGLPYRNWRPEITKPEDIWDEIVSVASDMPGMTTAPMLQPISTRIVMLQSGIRAPVAVRIRGDDLDKLAEVGVDVERILRDHPDVSRASVNADRPMGKPYLEIHPDREQLARYGVSMERFQNVVEVAIGGRGATDTVEGRERFTVRVRYPRELRDGPEDIEQILVTTDSGEHIPLGEVADIEYVRGPQSIRSEDTYLVNYVMFESAEGVGEVDAVEGVRKTLDEAIDKGDLELPEGVSYNFTGSYENSVRAEKRLRILVPLVCFIIFMLIYFQFRSTSTALMIFSGIAVAFAGGFILLWLYGQPWFLDFSFLGTNLRDVFQIMPIKLSVAVWVGFIALFGIAADDGIVMATYLKQRFAEAEADTREAIHERVVEAGKRRIRPCLMTTATTVLALLPILTSYGTGADVMIPMAVPAVGGMTIALITLFVVPLLYAAVEESKLWVGDRIDDDVD
ncbi:MAG: efflux RND transporter permease subunit [Persicimonas sp.]